MNSQAKRYATLRDADTRKGILRDLIALAIERDNVASMRALPRTVTMADTLRRVPRAYRHG